MLSVLGRSDSGSSISVRTCVGLHLLEEMEMYSFI